MITRKTKIIGVFSLLSFIAVASGVIFMWLYVENKGTELIAQVKEVSNFHAREQVYKELENLVSTTEAERSELRDYILTEEEVITFLATIEEIAIEQGVDLTTNSLKVVEGAELFDALTISYSIEGLSVYVDKLLSILEKLPYHTFISNVSMSYSSKNNENTARGSIELMVSLVRYDR